MTPPKMYPAAMPIVVNCTRQQPVSLAGEAVLHRRRMSPECFALGACPYSHLISLLIAVKLIAGAAAHQVKDPEPQGLLSWRGHIIDERVAEGDNGSLPRPHDHPAQDEHPEFWRQRTAHRAQHPDRKAKACMH